MDKEVITAIGVAAGAILTPICAAMVGARGTRGESDPSTIRRLRGEIAALRAEMAEADRRADADLREARDEVEVQRRSGMRWYELVLFWFAAAHRLRHAALNARASAEACSRLHDRPLPVWTEDLNLPAIEEPIPAPAE